MPYINTIADFSDEYNWFRCKYFLIEKSVLAYNDDYSPSHIHSGDPKYIHIISRKDNHEHIEAKICKFIEFFDENATLRSLDVGFDTFF